MAAQSWRGRRGGTGWNGQALGSACVDTVYSVLACCLSGAQELVHTNSKIGRWDLVLHPRFYLGTDTEQ